MSPLTLIVIAFMIGLVAMSFAFSGGAVIVTLPLALVVIAVVAAIDVRRRAKQARTPQEFRQQAKAEKTEFNERDQETLVSE
jgi:membrane protein implicated in regulation of membrane protease activity